MGRIVVGFDGSSSAVAALAWAVEEARLRGWQVGIVVVLEPAPFGVEVKRGDDPLPSGLRLAVEELTSGVPTEVSGVQGGPAAELIAACTASDILVVGSRGRNPFAGLLLGSVSRACLHHAPATVVVVRPSPSPSPSQRRVIVGIDESEHARRALAVAAEEAALRGAELQVIHAVHWDHLGVELIVPTTRQLRAWGKELVKSQLAATKLDARVLVLNGHASDLLVRHSSEADLLVLGSRGHNALDALDLGSTSDYCARHGACPVMIVRGDEEAATVDSADR